MLAESGQQISGNEGPADRRGAHAQILVKSSMVAGNKHALPPLPHGWRRKRAHSRLALRHAEKRIHHATNQ
jgi:hypothetical protein